MCPHSLLKTVPTVQEFYYSGFHVLGKAKFLSLFFLPYDVCKAKKNSCHAGVRRSVGVVSPFALSSILPPPPPGDNVIITIEKTYLKRGKKKGGETFRKK